MVALVASAAALQPTATVRQYSRRLAAVTAEPAVAAAEEPAAEEPAVEARAAVDPAGLVSALGINYEPLMEQLRTGDFKTADQTTRDVLIEMAGAEATKRGYVYWTEAKVLPKEDLATVENLWLHYSDGKFGYTVQKNAWRLQKGVFDKFCDKIGWTVRDEFTDAMRKRRWFGDSEFFYTLKEAPKGHLPLTSALRGTQLLKALLQHTLWETDDWKRELTELSA